MSLIKKIPFKIKPNNNFGYILNKASRYFAIFGGLLVIIANKPQIYSLDYYLETKKGNQFCRQKKRKFINYLSLS